MRILIAEDDMTSKLFMKKFLEKYGECDFAVNGLEAITCVSEAVDAGWQYDLICMDVMMPKVDGIKALKSIRKLEEDRSVAKTAKIIMTTALNDKETIDESFRSGVQGYVWKPIDVTEFLELMKQLELV